MNLASSRVPDSGDQSRREFLKRAAALTTAPLLVGAAASAAITAQRYPYVQNVGSDHASVLWTSKDRGVGSVQYSDGKTEGFAIPQVRQFDPADTGLNFVFYQYQADLSGLREATEYFYRVFVEGNLLTPASPAPELSFLTASRAPFTFLVVGDTGEGTNEQRQLAARLAKDPASLLLHVGDVVYPAGELSGFENLYFAFYRDMMAKVPSFPCPGNHDYETKQAAPYLSVHSPPASNVPAADRGRYYSFDWGDVHFISLDSNTPLQRAAAGMGPMLDWLDKDLQSTRKFWRIVFFHHPPYPISDHINDPLCILAREKIVPILERYRATLVINGHEHLYERTKSLRNGTVVDANSGTQYLVSGGGGASLFHNVRRPEFLATATDASHYLRCEVTGTRLTVRAIGLDGKDLDSIELAPLPSVYPLGIVNAASFDQGVAPGSLVGIFGAYLAGREDLAARLPLPTDLSGTRITVNGAPIPLIYVSPGQINAQLPFDVVGKATVRITTANGTAETTLTIDDAAPGIFDGGSPAVVHPNGSLVSAAQPVEAGEFISIYATGLGRVNGAVALGQATPSTQLFSTASPVEVKVGALSLTPIFAGLAPGYVGLYQVVVQMPADMRSGSYPLQLSVRTAGSNRVNVNVHGRTTAESLFRPTASEWTIRESLRLAMGVSLV